MDKALLVYSWQGILTEEISATEIKSREQALKLGPFVGDGNKLVYWRKAVFEGKRKLRSQHFCKYPKGNSGKSHVPDIKQEFEDRICQKKESPKHKKAKLAVADLLRQWLLRGKELPWGFNDPRASDFSFSGNLLADVVDIKTEYSLRTPFGNEYQLDIALLGKKVVNEPIILGGIEIEFTNKLDMSKCLFCKCLGFPLMTMDVEELKEEEIDEAWAYAALVETTTSSPDGRRRNFIYLHDVLYPVYANFPYSLIRDDHHQFIVFVKDEHFEKLTSLLIKLKNALALPDSSAHITSTKITNEQTKKTVENAGSIAGPLWRTFNPNGYILVTLKRPVDKSGSVYKFHLVMAYLLNAYFETLVGYKLKRGAQNWEADEAYWIRGEWIDGQTKRHRILRKHLSEPVSSILRVLDTLEK
jgi:hypothetical protein